MAVVYIVEQGATIRKEQEQIVVVKQKEELQRLPAVKVEQVVLFGNVNLTTPAIAYFLKNGIDVVFLSTNGSYYGRLISPESGFGELRLRQAMCAQDGERRLALARSFVRGKLQNQRTFLMRYARLRNSDAVDAAVAGISKGLLRLETASSLAGLQGLEGQGSALYFRALKDVLKQDLGFTVRARRPPTDPVNSLLSFGYTLLRHAIQASIHAVGLDPYVGYLHAIAYARPSLALDLMEEFRTLIVDSVVLKVINSHILTAEHFRPPDERGGVYLTEEGQRRFIAHYEARTQTQTTYPSTGERVTYRRCSELQVRHLARVLLGREGEYVPMTVR